MGGSNVMIGGEGPKSYAQNSTYQGSIVDIVKTTIDDEISRKLDVKQLSLTSSNCFWIADFGCATGHNSFRTMEVIVNAIEKKYNIEGLSSQPPDFQVFFNDQVMNDFNTLFTNLSPKRRYHVAGVPGSFQKRLLPKNSLHFAHSSWSLHWLSEVPKEIVDIKSVAWNRGNIHYEGGHKEVRDAYSSQYAKDIEAFLESRSQELICGGLMTLLIPAVPEYWDPETSYVLPTGISILGSCLMDMANEGNSVSEADIDSCNIPIYLPNPEELKAIIQRNHNFTIEKLEILTNPPSETGWHTPNSIASFTRSALEGSLKGYFTIEVIDESFDRFVKKVSASTIRLENDKTMIIFVVLRCDK